SGPDISRRPAGRHDAAASTGSPGRLPPACAPGCSTSLQDPLPTAPLRQLLSTTLPARLQISPSLSGAGSNTSDPPPLPSQSICRSRSTHISAPALSTLPCALPPQIGAPPPPSSRNETHARCPVAAPPPRSAQTAFPAARSLPRFRTTRSSHARSPPQG